MNEEEDIELDFNIDTFRKNLIEIIENGTEETEEESD